MRYLVVSVWCFDTKNDPVLHKTRKNNNGNFMFSNFRVFEIDFNFLHIT
jgi:hypothetical protein